MAKTKTAKKPKPATYDTSFHFGTFTEAKPRPKSKPKTKSGKYWAAAHGS